VETARLATSKLRQRERLDEACVPQPRWTLLRSPAAVGELELAPPFVVKAPDRQGQRGLTLVPAGASRDSVAAAVEEAITASRAGAALVEELAPGGEVTVNGFSVDGSFHALTVTDRLTADPPAFGVALAHVWPAANGADVAAGVAADAVRALGIGNGPSYTQVRLGEEGPRVIEVAARLGGGHDAELCLAAVGVDLNGLALDSALGRPIARERLAVEPRAGGACVRFLVAPPGEVAAVDGLDAARAAQGVRAVHVYRRPGDVVRPLRIGADRAGAVLTVGTDAAAALARADEAARLVGFT
jgi:biotin carboxylase